jgi:hypothetical protein
MTIATDSRIWQTLEVGFPGIATGLVAGAVVGGLAALIGQPIGWALTGALVLGVLLASVGAVYGVMLARGWGRPGLFAPAALLWLVGFPLARLVHATYTPVLLGGAPTPPADVLGFLAYQGIVSMGYAVGFIWLHERVAPYWFLRIRGHNPVAARIYETYSAHAESVYRQRTRRRAARGAGRASRGGT